MLTALTVHNLVVVREIDIELGAGLTVLTGETGAGKSILIEALGLALGGRGDTQLVRPGAERASVCASFDLGHAPALAAFLREHELEAGEECVLRRVIARDGRSRAWCNESPVTVQLLRELGALLVDIHAQHSSHSLLAREHPRTLLDAYGDLGTPLAAVATAHAEWKQAEDAIAALERDGRDRARLDLLRYQVEELAAARIDAAEIDSIEQEHKRLANSATILEHCATLRQALADEELGAATALRVARGQARALGRLAPEAGNLGELLAQADLALEEALSELDRLEGHMGADPERLQRLDTRLAELHGLARKHQVSLAELAAFAARLTAELGALEARSGDLEALQAARERAFEAWDKAATRLSAARARVVKKMDADITARLRDLGIPHAAFHVNLAPLREGAPQAHGRDRVEFTVTTNPDQAPGPLSKVASGGELSRISLAIQAATARHAGIPVVVYDEVDTGIGGTTANVVGRNLRDVAAHCQVICITHSPQVASAGDQHLLVEKRVADGHAETHLRALDASAREQEIARMLGAARATDPSLEHARDLLRQARAN
ncbi:MAG: DNA repair protein RecN [Gammaproteobacteria bacterium]